jgi:hypothetical protein
MCETRWFTGNVTRFLVAALAMVGAGTPQARAGGSSGSTTVLAVSAGSVAAGTVTTLTSTTTFTAGGAPVPRGLVTFCSSTAAQCDGAAVFGTAAVTSNGTASIKVRLGAGSYSIKAVFAAQPTANITGSSSAAESVTVTGAGNYATSTTIGASGSIGNYTLTGTVTAFGKPTATGTVSFLDSSASNASIATANLDPTTLGRIFTAATNSPLSGQPFEEYVIAADFNNDGKPDLAVINNDTSGTIAIYLGNGDGTFQAPTTVNSGGFPKSFTVADVNGDGDLDLIVPVQSTAQVAILLGHGDGTFAAPSFYAVGNASTFVAVGDFNGDGKPDLVVVNDSSNNVSVLLGNGDGTFQAQTTYSVGNFPEGVAVGDFNNDGKLDLAVSDGSGVSLLLGNGNGTFGAASTIAVASAGPAFLMAGDLRGNGTLDLVYPDGFSANVYVLLGNNDGTFQTAVAYPTGDVPQSLSLGDIDGDGILDIVAADTGGDGLVSILLGKGNGTFSAKTDYTVGSLPENVVLADFNGDGLLDLATSNIVFDNTTTILLQQLVETATATGVSVSGNSAPHPVLASYPGDAAHSASMSTTTPLIGTAQTATTTALGVSPNPTTFGQTVTMTATISPTPTGTPLGTVNFFSGTTLLGSGTVNASGVATFTISGLSAGVNSITAEYSGNASFGGSTSSALFENVHATTTTSTTLALSSATVTAGTATTMTATVSGACSLVTSGSVIFCDASAAQCSDAAILGTVQLKSDGTAVLKRTFGVGAYSIKAVFAGRNDLVGSSSSAQALTVSGNATYPSATIIGSAGSNGVYNLTGTVSGFGVNPLSGTVSFLDTSNSNAVLGSAAISPASIAFNLVAASGSPLTGTDGPEDVVTADFNGDGILDLAVVNDSSPNLSIYIGKGDGRFADAVNYPLANSGAAIAFGDFNGDGKLDLVVTSPGEFNTFSIFLGNGDGTFQAEMIHDGGPFPVGVVVSDFNNDGKQDVAIADIDGGVSIFLGNGDGTFPSTPIFINDSNGPVYLATRDLNGDGIPDLAVAELAGLVSVYIGNGDGTFQTAASYTAGSGAEFVVIADFNKDGKLDLAVANSGDNNVSILLGNGDGTFQPGITYPTGAFPEELVVGDFNHDGILDIADSDDNATTVSVLYGNGDGTFQAPVAYDIGGDSPYGIIAGDFNGDGLLDIAATTNDGNTVAILLNQQTGTATAASVSILDGSLVHNVLASYPGDGSRAASMSSTIPLTGVPPATTMVTVTAAPNPAVVGQSVTFTATIAPVPTGTPLGTVSFCLGAAINPGIVRAPQPARRSAFSAPNGSRPANMAGACGANTLLGTVTVTASGVVTFSSSALVVGTAGITAVYSGNSSFATATGSINEVVNAPAATTTSLAVSPNTAAAGQPLTLTATIAPTPTGSPLGTVNFFDGETLLGMGTVNASGIATLTTSAVITTGINNLTAVYSGNALFATSTSAAAMVTITPGYTVMTAQTSFAVTEGGAVAIPVTVPPLGGAYTNVVSMSATGLPPGATGMFTPPMVTPGAAGAPTTLTIQLKTLTVSGLSGKPGAPRNFALIGIGLLLALGGALLSFLRRALDLPRRELPRLARLGLAGAALAGVVLLFAGCNGGFAGTPITTKGSYTVTITGTSGALHPSTTVTVVVQ